MEMNDKRKVIAYGPLLLLSIAFFLSPFFSITNELQSSLNYYDMPYFIALTYIGGFFLVYCIKKDVFLTKFVAFYFLFIFPFIIGYAKISWSIEVANTQSSNPTLRFLEELIGSQFLLEQKKEMISSVIAHAYLFTMIMVAFIFIFSKWAIFVRSKDSNEKLDVFEFLVKGIFNNSVKKSAFFIFLAFLLVGLGEDFGMYKAEPDKKGTLSYEIFE